jgi:hypothetical protein
MFGGVLSALMVGFILERGDLYANVVADSYAQGAQDEEFWKGLSEEEKKKAEEMLQRIRDSKAAGAAGGGAGAENAKNVTPTMVAPKSEPASSSAPLPMSKVLVTESSTKLSSSSSSSPPPKEVDMFSDYAE